MGLGPWGGVENRPWAWVFTLLLMSCGRKEPERATGTPPAAVDETQFTANERSAIDALGAIATAESDFRSNDRDNNRVNDFWTGDVAGLHCIDNSNTRASPPALIRLIELSLALADLDPVAGLEVIGPPGENYSTHVSTLGKPLPRKGYWFLALYGDAGTRIPFRQATGNAHQARHNFDRFGFCAIPAQYGITGRRVFIVREGNSVFSRDFGKDMLDPLSPSTPNLRVWDFHWPGEDDLKRQWKKE